MKVVYIATKNKGKIAEFKDFFKKYQYEVKSLLDIDSTIEIEETGKTFKENALLKARYLANRLQETVLADDSGLEVAIINNEPGIYSARYAGVNTNSAKNNQKLLEKLKGVSFEKRHAEFICVLALVRPNGEEIVVEGRSSGFILEDYHGENGFGYDPLFYVPQLNKTYGEMTSAEKEEISHRGIALRKLSEYLSD